MSQLIRDRNRKPLDTAVHNKLQSECPRFTISNQILFILVINHRFLALFTKYVKDPKKGIGRAWSSFNDKVLDVMEPVGKIFDMAKQATKGLYPSHR